jgi:hypothetical protein
MRVGVLENTLCVGRNIESKKIVSMITETAGRDRYMRNIESKKIGIAASNRSSTR